MVKRNVTDEQFLEILDSLTAGKSLATICKAKHLPSSRTILRYVQDDEEAYKRYRTARAIQAEMLKDEIIALVERPLEATDPRSANAEVGRRKLEVETKEKFIRQLAPLGIRDKAEDKQASGTITLSWEGAEIISS